MTFCIYVVYFSKEVPSSDLFYPAQGSRHEGLWNLWLIVWKWKRKSQLMLICRFWWSGTTSTTLLVVLVPTQSGTCLSPVSWHWWDTTLSAWHGQETWVCCKSAKPYFTFDNYFTCRDLVLCLFPSFPSCILKCLSPQWLQPRRRVPLMEALMRCVTEVWSVVIGVA